MAEENYDKFRKKKQRKNQIAQHETVAANKVDEEDGFGDTKEGSEKKNLRKKKKKNVKKIEMDIVDNEALDSTEQQHGKNSEFSNLWSPLNVVVLYSWICLFHILTLS